MSALINQKIDLELLLTRHNGCKKKRAPTDAQINQLGHVQNLYSVSEVSFNELQLSGHEDAAIDVNHGAIDESSVF